MRSVRAARCGPAGCLGRGARPAEQAVAGGAGAPIQAPPDKILHVDLYGSAVVLEEFGQVMARGSRNEGRPTAVVPH